MLLKTSWDDGSKYDIRLAKLLKKYNLPAIFYIPSNCELSPMEILSLYQDGFEIGGHTENHPDDLKKLSYRTQTQEILNNKLWLETILSEGDRIFKVASFCYPSGKYDYITEEIVKKCGFTNARTTVQGNTDYSADKLREKTSIHIYPETVRYEKPDWYKEGLKLYDRAKEKNGVFHIWGHSWEINEFGLWDELEEFFSFLNDNKEEWNS